MKFELANLPGLVYWKDLDSTIVDSNSLFAQLFGYSTVDEIIGKTPAEIAWNEPAATRMLETDKQVLSTKTQNTGEENLKNVNGEIIKLVTSKSILFDDQNNVIGILCISHDITLIRNSQLEAEIDFV